MDEAVTRAVDTQPGVKTDSECATKAEKIAIKICQLDRQFLNPVLSLKQDVFGPM